VGTNRLGEWEVLGELARGGQGVVLRARHAVHGTPAAIKLLLRVEQRTLLRFRQEAAVLLRLNHPNLVRDLEVGEHEAAPFLAMELVSGQSLADVVR
jgi:serine/threonine protein kinase